MICNSNIILRKIPSSPSTFPLPLLGTRISRTKHTQKRNNKIFIQRVTNKPNILIPHKAQKLHRIDPGQITSFGHPFVRIDESRVGSLVPKTVPSVSLKWARLVVQGFVGGRVLEDPFAQKKIARGRMEREGFGGGWWEERGVEKEEEDGEENQVREEWRWWWLCCCCWHYESTSVIDHPSADGENWKRESDGRNLEDGNFTTSAV